MDAATIASFQSVLAGLQSIDAGFAAAREAAAVASMPTSDDGSRLEAMCADVVALLDDSDSIKAAQQARVFKEFSKLVSVPPALLTDSKRNHLIQFVKNAPRSSRKKTLDEAKKRADKSEAVATARSEAAAARASLAWSHRAALARSDHAAIRVTLRDDVGGTLRVSSHNVQELVADGINTYLRELLPLIGGKGASTKLLMDAILDHPCVQEQQSTDAVAFVEAELEGGSLAVCLQEVTPATLSALQAAATPRGWVVHHSQPPPAKSVRPGGCSATTCIILPSTDAAAVVHEPDVVVDVPRRRSEGFRTRRYAALTIGRLTLVSTHVLHAPDGDGDGEDEDEAKDNPAAADVGRSGRQRQQQPSNTEQIWQSAVEIGAAFAHRLAAGGILLAVGDWNGTLRLGVSSGADESGPPHDPCAPEWADLLREMPPPRTVHVGDGDDDDAALPHGDSWPCAGFCAASPDASTQLGNPSAVDGAMAMSRSRLRGLSVTTCD